MNTIRKTLVIAGYGLLLLSCGALAQPTIPITIDTFGSGNDLPVASGNPQDAWFVGNLPGEFSLGMSVAYVDAGPLGDVLQVTLTQVQGLPGVGDAVTADSDFQGDYTGLTVMFELTGGENLSRDAGLALYFNSDYAGSSGEWVLNLTPGSGTQSYYIPMDGQALWEGSGTFLNAIKSITQIGVRFGASGEGPYTYYLDNFEVAVPEPETVWMMLAVVVSLGVTFRSRLAELAGQVKARFVKA